MFPRALRLPLYAVTAYAGSLGMMAVHEAGHVLHARVSGGVVADVSLPLLGFSQTFYAANPKPRFVAWGGAVWGCLIPLMALAALARGPRRVRRTVQFFAGFCLIANGAYLGVGWTANTGDAADLHRFGVPVGVLVTFGVVAGAAGLLLWHVLGVEARRVFVA